MYMFTPNMKFLCLTMWLVGLYTDNVNDTNPYKDAGRRTKRDCIGSSVFVSNDPKTTLIFKSLGTDDGE